MNEWDRYPRCVERRFPNAFFCRAMLCISAAYAVMRCMCVCVCVCVCVYVPHNDQLGRTDFPHNALSPQCIVGTCVCLCVRLSVTFVDHVKTNKRIFKMSYRRVAKLF